MQAMNDDYSMSMCGGNKRSKKKGDEIILSVEDFRYNVRSAISMKIQLLIVLWVFHWR